MAHSTQGPDEWRAHVYQHRGIGNGVRVLLIMLSDRMNSQRHVSVPRSQLAQALAISPAEVTKRISAAHEAGLLDTVVKARPKVTAVYQGLFARGHHGVTSEHPSRGHDGVTSEWDFRGTGNRTSETASRGNPVVSPSSKHMEASAPVRESPAARQRFGLGETSSTPNPIPESRRVNRSDVPTLLGDAMKSLQAQRSLLPSPAGEGMPLVSAPSGGVPETVANIPTTHVVGESRPWDEMTWQEQEIAYRFAADGSLKATNPDGSVTSRSAKETAKSKPAVPLPETWVPGKFHISHYHNLINGTVASMLDPDTGENITLAKLVDYFRTQMQGQNRRDWDRAFGHYLNSYADDRFEVDFPPFPEDELA